MSGRAPYSALDEVWTGPPSSGDHLAWLDEQPATTDSSTSTKESDDAH